MNAAVTAAALVLSLLVIACDHNAPVGSDTNNQGSSGSGAIAQPGTTSGNGASAGSGAPASGAAGTRAPGSTAGSGSASNAAGSGTAGPTTPSAGTSGAAGGGAPTSGGGYIISGKWMGYAWTGTTGMGSTIMPKDFTGLAAGAPLCVMGSVAASMDYSAVGMLGVNLNQAPATNAPLMAATPTGTGLMIDITNTGNSLLRVQVQGLDGDMNAEHRWCAPVSGKGGMIPWASFNTKCWDNSGTAYAMEPISTMIVSVPSMMAQPVSFNFCLNSVSEAGATGAATAGTSGSSSSGSAGMGGGSAGPGMGSGMLIGQFDWHDVSKAGHNYIVQNNVWGGGSTQTVTYEGTSFQVTQHTGSNPTTGQPSSYPSVFIGSNNGHATAGSNLPKQVSALGSVQTSWSQNAGPSVAGTYNAAYDVWFSTNPSGDSGAPSGGYLMVWMYKTDGVQPLGNTIAQSGATIAGVDGTWDVWIGQQMGKPCISYVRAQPPGSITFDLNHFIQDAVKRPEKPIQASWYLTNVFAGFEIWSGGTGLKTNDFSAVVQ